MKKDDRSQLSIKLTMIGATLLYSMSVWAADDMLTAFEIPLAKFGYVLLMAFWGGLASVLQRFAKEGFPTGKTGVVIASDMVNATLASIIVFLVCETWAVRPALEAVACSLAGFGGSRFMTAIYLRFEKRATDAVGPPNPNVGDQGNAQ
jgi:uncharacterized membrane protein